MVHKSDTNPGIIAAVDDVASVLGNQIRAARHDRNFTAKELAFRAGVSERTVLAVEAGSLSTRLGNVLKIALAAGVRLFQQEDYDSYTRERIRGTQEIALLPARVTHPRIEINTDF